MAQFDRFTERARKVLQLAQEEAQRFNHNYIGTEHLLLGLVREGDGVAARVLKNMGVQLPKVRSVVEFVIGRGDEEIAGEIGLTPRSKKVLELAVDESRRLKNDYVGTEHLLLGLVREGEGIAAGALESLGIDLHKVRDNVLMVHGGGQLPEPVDLSGRTQARHLNYMFPAQLDRLDSRMFAVLAHATKAAGEGALTITTGHLLLGLLAEGGPAAMLLRQRSIDAERVTARIGTVSKVGEGVQTRTSRLSTNVLLMLSGASPEFLDLIKPPITPEHVLLPMTGGTSEAAEILAELGVDLEALRNDVQQVIEPEPKDWNLPKE